METESGGDTEYKDETLRPWCAWGVTNAAGDVCCLKSCGMCLANTHWCELRGDSCCVDAIRSLGSNGTCATTSDTACLIPRGDAPAPPPSTPAPATPPASPSPPPPGLYCAAPSLRNRDGTVLSSSASADDGVGRGGTP